MTGIASNRVEHLDLEMASFAAKLENSRVAKILGIKEASRVTCVKPAGTTSCSWNFFWYSRLAR